MRIRNTTELGEWEELERGGGGWEALGIGINCKSEKGEELGGRGIGIITHEGWGGAEDVP